MVEDVASISIPFIHFGPENDTEQIRKNCEFIIETCVDWLRGNGDQSAITDIRFCILDPG